MYVTIISGPVFVEEALFGIGLSYGLVSKMECDRSFRKGETFLQLVTVADKLAQKQGGHNKFLETIMLTLDITAPRYWWQEFDTYRVGVTKQSESTIHTIMKYPITENDFVEGIDEETLLNLQYIRSRYLDAEKFSDPETRQKETDIIFREMKAHLPEGYLQRRIVALNVRTLQNIYNQRKNHKLKEWHEFLDRVLGGIVFNSPYGSEVYKWITGKEI